MEKLKLIVTPAYSYEHDSNCDTDLTIQFKVEDLGGDVLEVSRWRMIIALPLDNVGLFLSWALENASLFSHLEFSLGD